MSRIDYLLDINHEMLEGRAYSRDGLNSLELPEHQLAQGQIDLAVRNIMGQPAGCFTLANLSIDC